MPAGAVRSFNRLGDFSYGTYIYSLPMQQCLVQALPCIGSLTPIGASLLASLSVAVALWHLVEKPAIALKRRPAAGALVRARIRRSGWTGTRPA